MFKRRKRLAVVALGALAGTGAAVAAFIVFSGVDGGGSGSVESTTTSQTAVTVTLTGSPVLAVGVPQDVAVTVTNNDPNAAHAVSALSGTFTSTPAECAASLRFNPNPPFVGQSIAAGATVNSILTLTAAADMPASCAGATWSLALSGTTSP